MGFIQDIRRILRHIPAKRQTLFFSATLPAPIEALTREMLKNPVTITLQRRAMPAHGITQAVYPVPQHLKAGLLVALLRDDVLDRALVFCRTKSRADRLARTLQKEGVRAEPLHGDRSQSQRTQALSGFRNERFRVLVATDIAARGIDVEALGHVVNYDVPKVAEDYVHRVGRTGRAELRGQALTFVSPDEEKDVRTIERALGKRLPRVTQPDFDYTAREPHPVSQVAPRSRAAQPGRPQRRSGARVSEHRRGSSAPATPRRPASSDRHGGAQTSSRRGVRVAASETGPVAPPYGRGRGSGPRRRPRAGKRR
jgi:ATP-dependent RNA helicase RhlE